MSHSSSFSCDIIWNRLLENSEILQATMSYKLAWNCNRSNRIKFILSSQFTANIASRNIFHRKHIYSWGTILSNEARVNIPWIGATTNIWIMQIFESLFLICNLHQKVYAKYWKSAIVWVGIEGGHLLRTAIMAFKRTQHVLSKRFYHA